VDGASGTGVAAMACRRRYPTDLSDTEWEMVEPLIPPVKPGGRSALHQRREIVNALAYWLRAGCAWRLLPHDLPPFLRNAPPSQSAESVFGGNPRR
jgi:transposase